MRYPYPASVAIASWLLIGCARPANAQHGAPSDFFARLRLDVAPREAVVYVDGFVAGEVDNFDGLFQHLPLVPGHHEIVVYLDGYRTLRQKVYLGPGSRQTIKDTLVRLGPGETNEPRPVPALPPPLVAPVTGMPVPPSAGVGASARFGTLSLRVEPADASIFIDGQLWRGPQSGDRFILQLSEGPHRLRVEKEGYHLFAVDIEVLAGETASFNLGLVQ